MTRVSHTFFFISLYYENNNNQVKPHSFPKDERYAFIEPHPGGMTRLDATPPRGPSLQLQTRHHSTRSTLGLKSHLTFSAAITMEVDSSTDPLIRVARGAGVEP